MIFRPYRALLLPLLILCLLLTACQQNTLPATPTAQVTPGSGTPRVDGAATRTPTRQLTPTAKPTPTTREALGADPGALQGKEIDFWHPWQGELAQRAQRSADEFNRVNEWGVHVRVRAFDSTGAMLEALAAAQERAAEEAASGTGAAAVPDLIVAPSELLSGWMQESGSRENGRLLVDLNDYIHESRVGLSEEEINDYLPAFWAQDEAAGLRFGLPALREARVLFYNQGWAADLGFNAPPATPADFKKQACAAAQKNNTSGNLALYGTGGLLVDSDALTMLSWLSAFGAQPLPEKDNGAYQFESEESEAALEYLRDLVEDGCAWIARSGGAQEHFARRKAIFYTGTLSEMAVQKGWQDQLASGDDWTILPFPAEEGDPLVYSSGYSYSVLKTTPEEQLSAWLFARWMSAPPNAARLGEALPSIPVTGAVATLMKEKANTFPWNQILPLRDALRPVPGFASWRQARRPLEDAAWQVYHLPADGLPEILPQLDETVREVLR